MRRSSSAPRSGRDVVVVGGVVTLPRLGYGRSHSSSAFWACRRFSAWSQMRWRSP